MKVLAITLARGGSKGVPKKNIRRLHGQPLLAYAIKNALQSQYINKHVISTEDKQIAKIARDYGALVIERPMELAQDDTPSLPALKHAIQVVGGDYQILVDLRCTNPFVTGEDIDGAVDKLVKTGAESVIGVSRSEYPERIKRIEDDRIVDVIPEPQDGVRQNLAPAYVRNGSIYVLWMDKLEKLFGHEDSRPWIMEHPNVNIDTELDWLIAERLMEHVMGS